MSGKGSGFYRGLALQLLNTVVALLAINLVLAAVYGVQDRMRPPSRPGALQLPGEALDRAYPGMTPSARDSMLAEIWSRPLELEPHALLREPAFSGRFVRVSGNGFRCVPDQGPWPPDRRNSNVFLFGGSTTFGYGLPDEQTIAAHLQELLRRDARPGALPCVYNFGRAYLFSTPERELFERLLLGGHAPAAAVFIDGLNDFYFAGPDPEKDEVFRAGLERPKRPGTGELLIGLLARTPMGRLSRELAPRPTPGPAPAVMDSAPDRDRIAAVVERYRINQRLIAAEAAAAGVRPLFVWQPVPTYRYDLRHHAFQGPGFERHRLSGAGYAWFDSMRAAGAIAMAPSFLWIAGIAEGDTLPCYVDRVHYSGRMSRRIAERIARELGHPGSRPAN